MADLRLSDRACLVTGAASGIGLAIATRFAQAGAVVIATDVDEQAIVKAAATLDGARHRARALDVTCESAWEQVMDETLRDFERLDVLVNNAGVASLTSLEDTSMDEWRRVLAINLDGTFLGCKHAVRRMKGAGGGAIVNVSSVGALKASHVGPAYGASKAGVWNLTKTVALYCARAGYPIRCNSLHPGLTRTPIMEGAPAETLERIRAGIPMGRLGAPRDIANAALYLASDESAYVTGTQLVVDGGYSV